MGLRQGPAARRSVLARPQCRRLAMRQSIAQCTAASPQWPMRLASAIQQQPVVLLACQAAVAVQRMVSAVRDSFSRAFPQLQNVSKEVRHSGLAPSPMRRSARPAADLDSRNVVCDRSRGGRAAACRSRLVGNRMSHGQGAVRTPSRGLAEARARATAPRSFHRMLRRGRPLPRRAAPTPTHPTHANALARGAP